MGLVNAGASFQRVMNRVLQPLQASEAYIDDVIVGSNAGPHKSLQRNEIDEVKAHYTELRKLISTLEKHDLYGSSLKDSFFQKTVQYLGHILQDGQRLPAPGKLTAIEKWEIPKTVKEVRAFLGLCQYYAQYIPNFAGIATALTDSLAEDKLKGQKGVKSKRVHKFIPTGPISLTEQAVKSFYDLRQAMLDFVVLKLIDLDQDFILHTDASDFAVGGCLSQNDEEGNQ